MNKTLLGLCTLSLISACSGPAIKDTALIQQAAISEAQTSELDPTEAIETSRNLQISAQQQDLYYFSPGYMAQAEQEMQKAEAALKQNKPASETVTHSLTAQALFERGLTNKKAVLNQLKPSFDGMQMLSDINAHVLVKDDFEDIEDDIKDLIILIEKGKTSNASKDQQDVLDDITELEVETLKVAHFNPAENALEKAEDADAEDFAIKTYEIAEKAVEKLETLIESQYKNRELIADSAKATIRLAQHAEEVAKAAQPLLKLNAEQAEQHILYVESLLDRVKQAIGHDNINHMPLKNQSIALAQAVETLSKQALAKQGNAQWEQEKLTLEATIKSLKEQAQLNMTQAQPQLTTPEVTGGNAVDDASPDNSSVDSALPLDPVEPTPAQVDTLPTQEQAVDTSVPEQPETLQSQQPTKTAEPIESTEPVVTEKAIDPSEPVEVEKTSPSADAEIEETVQEVDSAEVINSQVAPAQRPAQQP